ncbi:MAG: LL-diaminopimelate aminotransferase [Erysipelotrichaceae bacterium]|nr:LL-diaminopimelate aminotransferase [Erysipelotrichaceae bacterium]
MLNSYLLEMEDRDLFYNVTQKVNAYKKEHPDESVISLGIGDVSRPVVAPVIEAMHRAVDDLASSATFHGYGAYYGCDFLRQAILDNEYGKYGFTMDEIYVSDGTKSDSTNILELFDINSKILIGNPTYPIYRDGARALSRKTYYGKNDENFKMLIPQEHYDIIYLCSPNNPIGNAYTKEEYEAWIDNALKNNAVLLVDNVYRPFIQSENVPDSIYELPGSKKVAIEFRSFSKQVSFTGVRCSYYVLPDEIAENVNHYWRKRTINRFNGACYVAQRGAEASFAPEAQKLIRENIRYYQENARVLREGFLKAGFSLIGGIDAPYMWVKTKDGMSAWEMFDVFLKEMNIIIIPGVIFGEQGEGHFRISALGNIDLSRQAIERIVKYYEK